MGVHSVDTFFLQSIVLSLQIQNVFNILGMLGKYFKKIIPKNVFIMLPHYLDTFVCNIIHNDFCRLFYGPHFYTVAIFSPYYDIMLVIYILQY